MDNLSCFICDWDKRNVTYGGPDTNNLLFTQFKITSLGAVEVSGGNT